MYQYQSGDIVQVLSRPSDYHQGYLEGIILWQFNPEYERGKWAVKLLPSGLLIVWDSIFLKLIF